MPSRSVRIHSSPQAWIFDRATLADGTEIEGTLFWEPDRGFLMMSAEDGGIDAYPFAAIRKVWKAPRERDPDAV